MQRNFYVLMYSTIILLLPFLPLQIQVSFSQNEDLQLQKAPDSNLKEGDGESFVVSDSETILLADTSLPSGSYLHLYDSAPFKLMNSHISAKIPCNDENATNIVFMFGPDVNIPISGLDLSPELSEAGELCLYEGTIITDGTNNITDIAIFNNSPDDIDFPDTSSIIVKVNQISPPSILNITDSP
jgi:hypothetical protein